MLWALSDPSGVPAKRFANLDPVPSIDWLEPLSENRYKYADLDRFGVTPKATKDEKLPFSFLQRPTPYDLAPKMTLVSPVSSVQLDEVMYHLARWLTRHLNDPKLVLWVAKQGGQLHDSFHGLIESQIEHLDRLEQDGKNQELDDIRKAAPNAIPRTLMRTLWRLALSGRLKSTAHRHHLQYWLSCFKQDGLTSSLRMELREILTPRVIIRKRFHWPGEQTESQEPQLMKDLVDWEIVLSVDYAHSTLRDLQDSQGWETVLPDLLSDFSLLLRDALDLMRELGGAKDRGDRSYIHQPSISRHSQNRHLRGWTALIELTRDAWLATAKFDPIRARLTAEGWRRTPYPLFKRLAFFAAAQDEVISVDQALDWLLGDDNWWLWSVETQREAIRLLVALATRLSVADMARLEHAVLQGPPREMFNDDIEEDEWRRIVDHRVWLKLAKLQDAGATLGETAQARLDDLTQQYPDRRLAPDQSDEFPFWMDAIQDDEFVAIPRRRRELVEWLRQNPSVHPMNEDDWRQRCRDSFPTTACALFALAQDGEWIPRRWSIALQAWADDTMLRRSWRYMARSIADAPDDFITEVAHDLSWWLREQAQTFEGQETLFFSLIRRILEMECQGRGQTGDPVFQAINHPVGHVTEALLHWWYRRSPRDNQGLPEEIQSFFTNLCDTGIERFRHGRVMLTTHVISLFRVDKHWTTEHLLPLFDWQDSEAEAHAAWQGFLGSPRLYRPLMESLKKPFLTTAEHFTQLGEYAVQYASFLTFVALDRGDTFTQRELADATRALPEKGLWHTTYALSRAIEGAGEQRSEYWRNRILPYFESIWPKSKASISPLISKSLVLLCISALEAFPEALKRLKHWLQPLENPDVVICELNKTDLNKRFPNDTLQFLDHIIDENSSLHSDWLLSCLEAIRSANPSLEVDPRFKRLKYRCQGS